MDINFNGNKQNITAKKILTVAVTVLSGILAVMNETENKTTNE